MNTHEHTHGHVHAHMGTRVLCVCVCVPDSCRMLAGCAPCVRGCCRPLWLWVRVALTPLSSSPNCSGRLQNSLPTRWPCTSHTHSYITHTHIHTSHTHTFIHHTHSYITHTSHHTHTFIHHTSYTPHTHTHGWMQRHRSLYGL